MLHSSPPAGRRPRILFLPNWQVHGAGAAAGRQTPDYYPADGLYWFFRHFERPAAVDVLDAASWRRWDLEERYLRLYAGQGLQALLREREYDLVFAFGAQSAVALLAATRVLPRRAGRPKVLVDDAGALNAGRPDRRLTFQATRWALRGADRIVWHASATEELMRRLCPELAARGEWFPFGASLADLDSAAPDGRAQGAPEGEGYALCAGNSPRAWERLVAAWPRSGPRLLLLGAPPLTLPKLPPSVRALPRVPFSEYARFVAGARVVLLPLPEGWSSWGQMTLLQAMGLGRPVVVTDVLPVRDYVARGCLTVPAGDMDALVGAALDLWDDADRRRALGADARRAVEEEFDERLMARRFEQTIAGLLG